MQFILDFLSANYYWILIIIIVILLAVIGYYADKTNFGQENELENSEDSLDSFADRTLANETIQSSEDFLANTKINDIVSGNLTNNSANKITENDVYNNNNDGLIEEKNEEIINKKDQESEFEKLYFETNSEFERVIEDSVASTNLDNLLMNNKLSNVLDDNLFDELTTNVNENKNKFELDELNKKIDLPKIDSLKNNKKNIWDSK